MTLKILSIKPSEALIMPPTLINLQNTPELNGIIAETVSFNSDSVTLKGTFYKPVVHDVSLSTVIVTGAWTTVKEQMAGTYARELANRGLTALAFDFTGWGESGGEPRYVEDPATKTADINAAVNYLTERNDVGGMYGLGICASSGYMATAVADNHKLEKLALVAPWLHNSKMAIDIYGSPETVASLIAATEAASLDPAVLTAASTTDDTAPMYQAPYYTETNRGLIPTYDNKFSILTWKPWLTYDAQASADRLSKPILMVGSPAIALPAGAEAYAQRTRAPLERLWLGDDVTQFDFYLQPREGSHRIL
ncbi:MAG: alpha/beta hydrolase [Symploca sp. SIO1A3]|nr:alpha/beta hydrolase [Symploca sp. SIO1A3]